MGKQMTDNPIEWRMHLTVPPGKVYDLLNSGKGRASFWAESAEEVDGGIDFEFINGQCYRSMILEREYPRKFSLIYFGGTATFELSGDGRGGTDLQLRHEGVPSGEWIEVHAGWLNVLFPLKAQLIYGVDLRNHDPSRTWDQGYADQ
ncbi:MAG: hypothetical protein R3281_11700 [Balneolaceae bacterium]|nr:hypothetical protein [Balneolaceae bacterium]